MRVQCCICTDLLQADSEVAAIVCGHVFHNACLMQWLGTNTKATCPECRKPVNVKKDIVSRLFFNQADFDPGEVDPGKLKNDLDSAKLALRQKDKEKDDLRKECQSKERQLDEASQTIENVRHLYTEEKAASKSLKKELASYQRQIKEAQLAKEDAKMVRTKLQELQAIQNLVKGSEAEADEIIQSHGDSKSLAIWCAMLKRELSEKKRETRSLREEHEKIKKDSAYKQRVIDERNKQLAAARERLKQSEEDLVSADKMITTQKRKIDTLLQSVNSPSGTGLRQRLLAESPAPQLTSPDVRSPNRKKPRLSAGISGDVDLDLSVELFPDLDSNSQQSQSQKEQVAQSPSVEIKKQCKDYGTKFVKITSAAGKSTKDDAAKRELSDIGNIAPPGFNFHILKKRTGFGLNSGHNSGVIKKGYNGFGSHEKFVQPMGAGVLRNKPLVKKTSGSKLIHVKRDSCLGNKKAPPLPNLSGFLTQS